MTDHSAPAGVDTEALSGWLAAHVPEVRLPVQVWLVSGGRSNLTFGLRDADGRTYCLRRPPLGHVLQSAHDVAREYRILSALQGTGLPVPATVAVCEDLAFLGAPFFLMRFVDGVVLHHPDDAQALDPESRRAVGPSMISALAGIHAVDVDAVGLGGLAKRDDYLGRQLRRWQRQLESGGESPWHEALYELASLLEHNRPEPQGAGIVHGDFKLVNVILDPGGQVRAVLDWELCTLGDPLADVGWLIASWSQPGDTRTRIVIPPTRAGGFSTPEELAAAYAAVSGRDLSVLPYYVAFAEWRWACIDVGIHRRFSSGAMGDSRVNLEHVAGEIVSRIDNARALLS